MTRLERLMKTVRTEQAVALLRPSAENVAELRLVQDRLLKYALRSDQSVPYDLFFFPPVIESAVLRTQVHDELIYEKERQND